MQDSEAPKKSPYLMLFCIATWVIVLNIIILFLKIPAGWTLFFANIFFFIMGAELKNLKIIFFGGITGIASGWILIKFGGILGSFIGEMPGLLVVLVLIIYIIIVLGPLVPSCFNNVAFAFLTIVTINMEKIIPETLTYMIVFVVGGAIMIAGCYGIMFAFTRKESQAERVELEESLEKAEV